jgi:2-oxoglutarate ferredoxin oxidoreductase subunit delta
MLLLDPNDVMDTSINTSESGPTPPKARKFRGIVHINWDRCKGCGFCVEFCPPKVLALSETYNTHGYHPPYLINEQSCTGCDLCGLYCPDFAIYGTRIPTEPAQSEVPKP